MCWTFQLLTRIGMHDKTRPFVIIWVIGNWSLLHPFLVRGGVHLGSVANQLQGTYWQSTIHNYTKGQFWVFNWPTMFAFGMWEEAGVSRENLSKHEDEKQTPHRRAPLTTSWISSIWGRYELMLPSTVRLYYMFIYFSLIGWDTVWVACQWSTLSNSHL